MLTPKIPRYVQQKKDAEAWSLQQKQYRVTRATMLVTAGGVLAAFVAGIFAFKQLGVMRGQLDEMTAARNTTIAQIRANLRREVPQITPMTTDHKPADVGKSIAYWEISPKWTNSGPTDALDYRGWFDIVPVDHLPGHFLTDADCPNPQAPDSPHIGTVVQAGAGMTQLAKKLSLEDAVMAKSEKGYILMVGHVEYSDRFPDTPRHSDDWCVVMIPNDLGSNLWSLPILKDTVK